ncbi:hypothetical protein [uncultured Faecalicoccus sp.]|uniref:hypothetical protein n=1 Tax=uncultured Faecalicoccus sp. TaxID=1971760 RepID=UPI00258E896C|nr:hypothetical protein [uncultured Faecalicoccus sp.]
MKKYLLILAGITTYFLFGALLYSLKIDQTTIFMIQNIIAIILLIFFIGLYAYSIRKKHTI